MTARPQKPRPVWKQLLAREQPLLLPFAHDALSARLIERAGFAAYGIGGFALIGARHGLPDVGLAGFGEISAGVRDIVAASGLPVLVDCDDGYGDGKKALWNKTTGDFLVYGERSVGINLRWYEDTLPPPPQPTVAPPAPADPPKPAETRKRRSRRDRDD